MQRESFSFQRGNLPLDCGPSRRHYPSRGVPTESGLVNLRDGHASGGCLVIERSGAIFGPERQKVKPGE